MQFYRAALVSLMLSALTAIHAFAMQDAAELYLEVSINGQKTGLIGRFVAQKPGRLSVAARELRELGLRAESAADDDLLDLEASAIPYRYDAARQSIDLHADEKRRIPRRYDARPDKGRRPAAQPATGAVLNYLVYAASQNPLWDVWSVPRQGAVSAALEGRIFSSFGVFSQTGLVTSDNNGLHGSVRLDTDWTTFDPDSYVTYRAGDLISGGLAWTRSLRLGGIQAQRAFSLRPDLITMPLAGFSGSAAVPSTVDVYVNNVRTFSQNVAAGPFEIANLPVMSGPGLQRVVIRDVQGREVVSDRPSYASAKLLRPGFTDFSVETGFRRLNYGVSSNDYQGAPVASASLRRGIHDWLTVEAHAEGDGKLSNGGVGAALPMAWFGVGTLAVAGSHYDGLYGMQAAASVEMSLWRAKFYVRTQRVFGNYLDVASLVTPDLRLSPTLFANLRPPRELDQLALSLPVLFDRSSVTLSATRLVDAERNRYDILGATWSRPVGDGASLFATVFKDFSGRRNAGVFAGLTVSLKDGISANAAVSGGSPGLAGGVEIVKSQRQEPGSYGWRLRDHEGSEPDRLASGSYRTSFGRAAASVQQFGSQVRATGEFEGSVAMLDGGVFLANRIDDAFAVVDVGAPNVGVFYQNRPIGRTDASGRLLVPNLRSYEANDFAIDPKDLPIEADIPRTRAAVTPGARGGAVVRFDVQAAAPSALIVLRDARGALLPVGAQGSVDGSAETFVVGYDGQVFVKGLSQAAVLRVQWPEAACSANVVLTSQSAASLQPVEVVCR